VKCIVEGERVSGEGEEGERKGPTWKRAQKYLRFYPWPMIRLVGESAAGQTDNAGRQERSAGTPFVGEIARICDYFEFLTRQIVWFAMNMHV
jgi:hypothetical protein